MFLYKQLNLKMNTDIRSSLKIIYGIGDYKSFIICAKIGFGFPYPTNNLNFYYFSLLSSVLDLYT